MQWLVVRRCRFHGFIRDGQWIPARASLLAAVAVLAAVWLVDPAVSLARGRSSYMRGMQQMMIRTAQAQQKMAQAIQKQQEADDKAFMERFDTNRDGKITGKERGPATKYMREKEMGIDPDAKLKKQQQATMKLGKRKPSKPSKKSISSKPSNP
jgi:hypothetical protein